MRGEALVAPFRGGGKLWAGLCLALILPSFVLGDYIGIPAKIVYFAALGGYFTAAFGAGATNDPESMASPRFDGAVLFLSGFAYALLAAISIGPSIWLAISHAQDIRDVERSALEARLADAEANRLAAEKKRFSTRYEWWRSDESFVFSDGHVGVVKGDAPVAVRRIGGGWVEVDPRNHSITPLPSTFRPGDPLPSATSEDTPPGTTGQLGSFEEIDALGPVELIARSKGLSIKLLLAIGLLLFGLWYIPAALSLAALGSPLDALGLVEAIRASARGRLATLTNACVAALLIAGPPTALGVILRLRPHALWEVLLVGPSQAAYRLGQAKAHDGLILAVALTVGAVVAAGLVGYRMGALSSDQPALFPRERSQ